MYEQNEILENTFYSGPRAHCRRLRESRPKIIRAEFIDSVTEALANGGQINSAHLQWTREPQAFEVKDGVIAITTAPHTDL